MKFSNFSIYFTFVSALTSAGQSFGAEEVASDLNATSTTKTATTRDRNFLTRSSDVKGYGKRDRLLPNSTMAQLPSQLHEVYGPRLEVGVDYSAKTVKNPTGEDRVRSTIQGPSVVGRVATSGDILAVSLGGQYGPGCKK